MTILYAIGAAVAVGLYLYLVFAMLAPEQLS